MDIVISVMYLQVTNISHHEYSGEHNYEYAAEVLQKARLDVHQNMLNSKLQQRQSLKKYFERTIEGVDQNGRLVHRFTLGPLDNEITVCRTAWASAHNVSVVMLETLSREFKTGVKYPCRTFSDASHHCADLSTAILALKNNNLEPTSERLKAMLLPNTTASRECYEWMKEYFTVSGDHMPNSKEIHLENTPLIRLHEQYKRETFYHLQYNAWIKIWRDLFPHVKLRQYKQV